MHLREDTSCFSLKWNNYWWGLEHEQFDALLVVTNRIVFEGITGFMTVAIVYSLQTKEGGKRTICYYTGIIFRTRRVIEGRF